MEMDSDSGFLIKQFGEWTVYLQSLPFSRLADFVDLSRLEWVKSELLGRSARHVPHLTLAGIALTAKVKPA